jgi:excisionase family DNA binding protein
MSTEPKLLRPNEVAAILRLDKRTVRRMADEGQLDSIRVGPTRKHRRYYADQVFAMARAGLTRQAARLEQSLNAIPGVSAVVRVEGPGGGEQSPDQPEGPPGPLTS